MSVKPEVAEADKASQTFSEALAQIGVLATADALAEWRSVPRQPGRVGGGWIDRLVQTILGRRRQARDLSRSYYRLIRALQVGATVAFDPSEGSSTTLTALRQDFAEQAAAVLPSASSESPTPAGSKGGKSEAGSGDSEDDSDRILVEHIKQLERSAAEAERAAEAELREALEALGSRNLEKKLALIDDEITAREADGLRKDAHAAAGARQAASASRIARNGARGELWRAHDADPKAIGYVRVSRTGTPCGWCAMLISRGFVYRSEKSATYDDGDLYHDNCNCYAIPVFSKEQFYQSDLFELNRKYADLWPIVTRGLSGKAALSAWRRYFRQEEKAKSARVAQKTNVQEA